MYGFRHAPAINNSDFPFDTSGIVSKIILFAYVKWRESHVLERVLHRLTFVSIRYTFHSLIEISEDSSLRKTAFEPFRNASQG